ncbi:uncharacterized protein [Rutidosis leptorrhynchoides]|uniref:uncharacterized protein n=1 Tax=Rutidosis leptorrhynchoides TaxID=125765 RepID=UPI003A99C263
MDSNSRESLQPALAFSHHLPFHHHHHHHHQCLEVSPQCPQHGSGYPNIHHHNHNHNHHHLQLSPNCPLHGHLLSPHVCPIHTLNTPIISNLTSIPNPNFTLSIPSLETNTANSISQPLMMQEMNEEYDDDDEEEVIYVLTDEWKEFFAKSEAKRRLAKKQAKKEG